MHLNLQSANTLCPDSFWECKNDIDRLTEVVVLKEFIMQYSQEVIQELTVQQIVLNMVTALALGCLLYTSERASWLCRRTFGTHVKCCKTVRLLCVLLSGNQPGFIADSCHVPRYWKDKGAVCISRK